MSNMVEIRWHGRGGQGAKTASLLLADAAFAQGKYVQGFPEYGPERMGAPIAAYNRISDERSSVHSNIYEPDFVVVVDATLLSAVAATAGLKETGGLVVNSEKSPEELAKYYEADLGGYKGKIYSIDASQIAGEELGNRSLSNTAMLAAIVKVSGVIPEDSFMKEMEASIKDTFSSKPHVIAPNMKAIERGLKEVKGL